MGSVEHSEEQTSKDPLHAAKQLEKRFRTIEEDDQEELEIVWDDVSGAELHPTGARKAREEEIQHVRIIDLYDKVFITERYKSTGKAFIHP